MKEKENIEKSIASNVIWRFAEKWLCQFISFVVSIIIARIISPSEYGVVAISNAIIVIFRVFIDSGLGNSLIQKKDADDLDFSTAFFTNVFFCLLSYCLIYFTAPFLATVYKEPSLILIIRVSGLIIIIAGLKNVQHAYISKNLLFKKFFFASLIGTIVSGIVGIYLALKGYGALALVMTNLTDILIDTICVWISIKWRPKMQFSFSRLRRLYTYGWKIFVSSLLDKIYSKIYQLVIGERYSSESLAFFDKGETVTNKITSNIDYALNSVLFSAMAFKQDEREKVKAIAKKTIKINVFIMTPLLIGLIAVCEPMVKVLLTDKWLPAVPFIRICCITNLFLPIHTVNLNVIKSVGRSDIFLKQEIIKKVLGILILFITIPKGVYIMAWGVLISGIIFVFINSFPNRKLINYGLEEQLLDIYKTIFTGLLMGVIVYLLNRLIIPDVSKLFIQILVGAIVYLSISVLLKVDAIYEILDYISGFRKKIKKL